MVQKNATIEVSGTTIKVTVTVDGTPSYAATSATVTAIELPFGPPAPPPDRDPTGNEAKAVFTFTNLKANKFYFVEVDCSLNAFGKVVQTGSTNTITFEVKDPKPVKEKAVPEM